MSNRIAEHAEPVRILVIDDDALLCRGITRVLRAAGYDVLEAGNGAQGLEAAHTHRPDIVVLDVNLPDINGLELCRQIKSLPACAESRVALISGIAITSDAKADGLEVGVDDYIVRPLSNQELLARIRLLIRLKQANDIVKQHKEDLERVVAERTAELRAAYEQQLQQESIEHKQAVVALQTHQVELEETNEELHTIESQLKKSEQKYIDLYDFAPVGYCSLDPKGRILEANLTAASLFGVERGNLVKTLLYQYLVEQDRDRLYLHLKQIMNTHIRQTCELRLVKPDGIECFVQLDTILIGQHQYRTAINDITVRKQAEAIVRQHKEDLERMVAERTAELRAANEQLQQEIIERQRAEAELDRFFNFVPDMMCIASTDGYFKKLNREWEHVLGYPQSDLLAAPLVDFIHPDDRDATFKEIERQLAGQGTIHFINRYRAQDGSYRWFDWNASPAKDGMLLFAAARDITDRKQTEEALRETYEILCKSQELAHIGSWNWKADPDTVTWTDELYRIAGLDPMLPAPHYAEHSALYTPESWKALKTAVEKAMEIGEPYQLELELIRPDGSIRCVNTFGGVKYDTNGRINGLYGIVQDITDRKRAEEELKRAKDAAEAANRVKSRFLAHLSHDLRTPLNSILGYAQIFRRQPNVTDAQQHGLDIMLRNGEHLLAMINDLLDFSAIEADKIVITARPFDVRQMARNLTELVRVEAEAKELTLICEVAPNLPAVVRGDETHLQQILLNLLHNAIKFTDQGCVTLRVCSRRFSGLPAPEGKERDKSLTTNLRFEVQDTGIGIPAEHVETIFEPFYQVSAGAAKTKGTGLGLSISRRLAHLMQSEICVRSVVGQGSVLWLDLTLPVVDAESAPPLTADAESAPSPSLAVPEPEPESITPPPAADVAAFYELARIGDILELRQRVAQLETSAPDCGPFIKKLNALARDIKLADIRAWLSQYLEEEHP